MMPIGDDNSQRRSFPFVNYAIILINLVVFFLELAQGQDIDNFIETWGVVPTRLLQNPVAEAPTILTAMFMHAGWLHIGGNLLFLWVFGDNVEDAFGHFAYILFYLVCGCAATMAHVLINHNSQAPSLGASGAIAGVLGAYLLLFPHQRIKVFIMAVFYGFTTVSAFVMIGIWFVIQFFSGIVSITNNAAIGGGVAFWAHIGGFITGLFFALILRSWRKVGPI